MITRRAIVRNAFWGGAASLSCLALPSIGIAAEGVVSLKGAGSTFAAPLYNTWIKVFHQAYNQIDVAYDAVGSGEGITRFAIGSVDFAASDVLPGEFLFTGVKRGMVPIPVTAGMIALAYNVPGLGGDLKLPRDVYSDIFSGRIRHWNDARIRDANPNLNLPNRDIAVIVRSDASGTAAVFARHLIAIGAGWHATGAGDGFVIDWPAAGMEARGNDGVSAKIKISEGSIGAVEYGFARRLGLQMASLENRAGCFVAPGQDSGQAALLASGDESLIDPSGDLSYPLVTPSWLLLYKKYDDPRRLAAVKDFVTWGLTTGQTIAPGLGYIALPSERALIAAQALDSISVNALTVGRSG
jgi:phosphate transport system substrate-binding protein